MWTKICLFSLSKSKRPEVLDSDDEKMESQQKKRRRIKKPQPDSSDDEGRKEIGENKGKKKNRLTLCLVDLNQSRWGALWPKMKKNKEKGTPFRQSVE